MNMRPWLREPKTASVMTAVPVRKTTSLLFWISVSFLLLAFVQMLSSLIFSAGVFIFSGEGFISPFHICLTSQHGEPSCRSPLNGAEYGAEHGIIINILPTVVILCLYIPVVLVAFALLAMIFAAYAKDTATLWFSMLCQAASSPLIFAGLFIFLLLNQSNISWDHMTVWFYLCVGAAVELGVTAVLTSVLRRRHMSDSPITMII